MGFQRYALEPLNIYSSSYQEFIGWLRKSWKNQDSIRRDCTDFSRPLILTLQPATGSRELIILNEVDELCLLKAEKCSILLKKNKGFFIRQQQCQTTDHEKEKKTIY